MDKIENKHKDFSEMTDEEYEENFDRVLNEDRTEFWDKIRNQAFDTLGYISVCVGDEPEGFASRVYRDKHRVIVGVNDKLEVYVLRDAPDYDWTK